MGRVVGLRVDEHGNGGLIGRRRIGGEGRRRIVGDPRVGYPGGHFAGVFAAVQASTGSGVVRRKRHCHHGESKRLAES